MAASKANQEYHHGNLRTQVLREAGRLLARDAERDFSLLEIAKKLGVSHAAIYRHFAGRKGILAALALTGYQQFGEALAEATSGLEGAALLQAMGATYLGFARRKKALFRAIFHPLLRDKSDLPELEEAARASFGELGRILARLGLPLRGEAPLYAVLIWSALHGAAQLEADGWIPGRSGLSKDTLEQALPEALAHVLLQGLTAQLRPISAKI